MSAKGSPDSEVLKQLKEINDGIKALGLSVRMLIYLLIVLPLALLVISSYGIIGCLRY